MILETSSFFASDTPSIASDVYLLFLASPQRARDFALSMHERAAWHTDHTYADLWSGVVTELKRMAMAQQAA